MGGRHLRALGALYESGMANVELVAVCDKRKENANFLADNANELLGFRPKVFTSLEEMKSKMPEIEAVDITTDSGSHHLIAQEAFELGYNVLCEKPLSLTIKGCNKVIEAWEKSGKVLSVAEQERRDPICRLNKAIIDAGIIGDPYSFIQGSARGGNDIIIWPWRHYKNVGGIFVDAGVHAVDQMMYYLGDIEEVFAVSKIWEPVRYRGDKIGVSNFYDHWADEVPESIKASSEDMVISTLKYKNGAIGQFEVSWTFRGGLDLRDEVMGTEGTISVSYTHLTLPTICSV